MNLFGERFQSDELTCEIVRLSHDKEELLQSQYARALGKLRPEMQVSLDEASADANAAIIFGHALLFGESMAHMRNVVGAFVSPETGNPFEWPASPSAKTVSDAFDYFIDNHDLFVKIKEAIKRVQEPNGVEGKPEGALTTAEKNSPLSVLPAANGSKPSAKSTKTLPIEPKALETSQNPESQASVTNIQKSS